MPPKVCLYPPLNGPGGPASFQSRLAAGLERRGVLATNDLRADNLAAVLVVGGSSNLLPLMFARSRGVKIFQRLDGMNWLHRKRRTGLRHFVRAELGNRLLALTRRSLAQAVIYQSQFSKDWWQNTWGADLAPTHIIHNAVDLDTFKPLDTERPPVDIWRLLVVEGNLGGGYEWGLEAAVMLANGLAEFHGLGSRPVELVVAGGAALELQEAWQGRCRVPIRFSGWLPRSKIPELDRSAHLLYAADLQPACPNSVIEALACGLPVLAFNTGAIPELIPSTAGRVVPYGANAWNLETPDYAGLVSAAIEILSNREGFAQGARQHAETAFNLEDMVDAYMKVLLG